MYCIDWMTCVYNTFWVAIKTRKVHYTKQTIYHLIKSNWIDIRREEEAEKRIWTNCWPVWTTPAILCSHQLTEMLILFLLLPQPKQTARGCRTQHRGRGTAGQWAFSQTVNFFSLLKKPNLPKTTTVHFCSAVTESTLTSSITTWYTAASGRNKSRLQCFIHSAQSDIIMDSWMPHMHICTNKYAYCNF